MFSNPFRIYQKASNITIFLCEPIIGNLLLPPLNLVPYYDRIVSIVCLLFTFSDTVPVTPCTGVAFMFRYT
jgi:hypothetical protein